MKINKQNVRFMDHKILVLLVMGMFMTFSCDNEFLTEGNPTAASVENSFNTEVEALQGLYAAYSGFQSNDFWAREFWWLPDMLSDETKTAGANLEAHRAALLNYNIDATNPLFSAVFKGVYRVIHRANLVINTLPGRANPELSQESIDLIVAEAKFLRAYCYFELVTYFGNVPFSTEPVTNTEGVPLAESVEDIYNLIVADLTEAEANLPLASAYRGTSNLGRATKGSAQGLLGRVELFRGNYTAARDVLQRLIDSGEYALADNYEVNHREENENNVESIWEIQFMLLRDGGDWQGWIGNGDGFKLQAMRGQEYSPFDWHNTLPSETLKAAFESGDPRYKLCFIEYGDTYGGPGVDSVFTAEKVAQGNSEENTHWRKYGNAYKQLTESLWSGINHRVIRYADVLLMMAEIENELNGPSATAINYVNMVRDRVDMPPLPTAEYPTSTKEELFAAIVHERQVELCSEQCRARDVKRWYREGKITTKPHENYESKHEFMPIPIDEIDNNPALSADDQKPGY
ncbi:RagB/SusD family nutrient uptake outer membrane protein [Marinoscillum furvescens]|nr:RagB/SusD family nutrient uptake outer membrane protein [Marinoscillum furvescens]